MTTAQNFLMSGGSSNQQAAYNPPNLFMGLSTKAAPTTTTTNQMNTSGSLGMGSNSGNNSMDLFSGLGFNVNRGQTP